MRVNFSTPSTATTSVETEDEMSAIPRQTPPLRYLGQERSRRNQRPDQRQTRHVNARDLEPGLMHGLEEAC